MTRWGHQVALGRCVYCRNFDEMIYYRGPLDKNLITGTAAAAVDCLFQIGGRKESDLYVYHDLYCNQLDSITRLPSPEKSLCRGTSPLTA